MEPGQVGFFERYTPHCSTVDHVGEEDSLKYLDGHKKLNTYTDAVVGVLYNASIYCLSRILQIHNLELPQLIFVGVEC